MANVKEDRKDGRNNRKEVRANGTGAKPGPIEWIVGGISAVIVLSVILFLLYQAVSKEEVTPNLTINIEQIQATGGVHHVEFRITNNGDATAAGVLVQGRLSGGGQVVEEREVTFDFVPGGSEARAALIFMNDPADHDLEIVPSGYREP